jgi:hypothetical protein
MDNDATVVQKVTEDDTESEISMKRDGGPLNGIAADDKRIKQ